MKQYRCGPDFSLKFNFCNQAMLSRDVKCSRVCVFIIFSLDKNRIVDPVDREVHKFNYRHCCTIHIA